MKKPERVMVIAPWSSFNGRRGHVTQRTPFVMVHLDGEREPMRLEDHAIIPEESERHIGGAE